MPRDDLLQVPEAARGGAWVGARGSITPLSGAPADDAHVLFPLSAASTSVSGEEDLDVVDPEEYEEEKGGEEDGYDEEEEGEEEVLCEGEEFTYDDPIMSGTRRAVVDQYLRDASAIALVYDIGDADTLLGLEGWLSRLEDAGVDLRSVPVALFCNKIDLVMAPPSLATKRGAPGGGGGGGGGGGQGAHRGRFGTGTDSDGTTPPRPGGDAYSASESDSDIEHGAPQSSSSSARKALSPSSSSSMFTPGRGLFGLGRARKVPASAEVAAGSGKAGAGGVAAGSSIAAHARHPTLKGGRESESSRGVSVGCGDGLRSSRSSFSDGGGGGGFAYSLRESFGRTFVGGGGSGSGGSSGGRGGGLFGSSGRSAAERLKKAQAVRLSAERRELRARLKKRVEEFPQIKVARALAESRGLLGHAVSGIGLPSTGLVPGPELVSAATGEGVHEAFSRLVVAIQRRRHAAQSSHFRPSGVSLGRPGGAAGADGLTAATLGEHGSGGDGGAGPESRAPECDVPPTAKPKRSIFSMTSK